MNFPTEQQYVLNRHKTGAATKDIIYEMTQVHGKDNVSSQNTVYCWTRQDLKNRIWLGKKEGKKLRAVKPKLTRINLMLVVAFTCSPPDFLLRPYLRAKQ